MTIALRPVPLPDFGPLGIQPDVPPETYARRADAAYARGACDWLVVYGDREHFGNIVFLSGFEPRFEEALLLLGPQGRRVLLTGNECESYAALKRLPGCEVLRAQSLSLMGQDRSVHPRLSDRLRDAGIKPGDTIGLVGWKYLEPDEDEAAGALFFAPDVVVGMLRRTASVLRDATPVLMHPETGLRAVVDADQIAAFEWAAARCSSMLWRAVAGVREGDTEFEAAARMSVEGDPLNVHTMFASASPGADVIGLRSPSARRLARGDGVTTALGLWGALSSRAGLLDTENDAFLDTAKSYFAGLVAWYETADLGVSGGALFEAVTQTLARGGLRSALNPGHLGSHEEWLHSPVRPRSSDCLRSGMVFQVDVIPTPMPAGQALNNEDTVAFADEALRAELNEKHPGMMRRVAARRRFMTDALGVALPESLLPLSSTPLYLPPFWLRPHDALARA